MSRRRHHRTEEGNGPVSETGPAQSRQRKSGQAFVEFALGMPLMLLIMLGTLDIGQVFIDYVQLRNACRCRGPGQPRSRGSIAHDRHCQWVTDFPADHHGIFTELLRHR